MSNKFRPIRIQGEQTSIVRLAHHYPETVRHEFGRDSEGSLVYAFGMCLPKVLSSRDTRLRLHSHLQLGEGHPRACDRHPQSRMRLFRVLCVCLLRP